MFMYDHVQVTLLSTEIWPQTGPSWQSPKSTVRRPFWIGPKFYLMCIKVLSQVITVPIHVWEQAAEWFPYVKYMENKIGRLAEQNRTEQNRILFSKINSTMSIRRMLTLTWYNIFVCSLNMSEYNITGFFCEHFNLLTSVLLNTHCSSCGKQFKIHAPIDYSSLKLF